MPSIKELLANHQVFVATDNTFQRRARLLQALWREDMGHPIGVKRSGELLGSMLAMPYAVTTGATFLTENIRAAARGEADASKAGSGQVIEEARFYANLLSSQPLCFNLFAELQADVDLAGRVMRSLLPKHVANVTAVRFEHAPDRGNLQYTGDRSAFDVFVEHTTPGGGRGFVGIEVKYHEDLNVKPAPHRPRYDEVAAAMRCFKGDRLAAFKEKPLEQLWRDHMLAGSMLMNDERWSSGLYVFLYPEDNTSCRKAVTSYGDGLSDTSTFAAITLETVATTLARETAAPWVTALRDRYLAWEKVDRLLAKR
jgi:hypothetical protein